MLQPTEPQFDADLAALQDAVEEAAHTLDHLSAVTAGDTTEPKRSLRARGRCPACGCGDLIHATRVLDRAEAFVRAAMALYQPSVWRLTGEGQFEAWICTGCGLMEWYVSTPDQVPVDGELRRRVQGPPASATSPPLQPPDLPPDPPGQLLALHQAEADLRAATRAIQQERFNHNGVINRSMRHRLCCPSCGCRELLHAAEVLDRADGMVRASMCLVQPRWHRWRGECLFEAWVCTGCGQVEWAVPDLSGVEVDDKHRSMIQGGAPLRPAGPPLEATREPDLGPDDEPDPQELQRGVAQVVHDVAACQGRLTELLCAATAVAPSLRRHQACPACGEREVLHVAEVLDRCESGRTRMTLVQPSLFSMPGAGAMEVWVCTGCGEVEWAIPDLSGVKPDGKKLRLVQCQDSPSAPYR